MKNEFEWAKEIIHDIKLLCLATKNIANAEPTHRSEIEPGTSRSVLTLYY